MLAPGIDHGCHRAAVNDVNAAALQWKSLIGKIVDGGREIQFAVEPGLDRVLIGRDDIDEMPGLQRPQMGIDNLRGKLRSIVTCALRGDQLRSQIDSHKNCRRCCEPTPNSARWKSSCDRTPRTEARENSLTKRGRSLLIELRQVHGRAQRLL